MDWNVCLLCQFPRSNGKRYTALGRSGWICDECIKLEICQSCRSKRLKIIVFASLALLAMLSFTYYSAAQIRGNQAFFAYMLSGEYLRNLPIKIIGWINGTTFVTWENFLLLSLVVIVIAILTLIYAAFKKPSFNRKNYDVQGNRAIAHLVYRKVI